MKIHSSAPSLGVGRRPASAMLAMCALLPAGALTALPAPADTAPSAEEVLAHPQAVNPFNYSIAVTWLWQHGRRQQAAFWFYVFQVRTRPWALADKAGADAAPLRSALNDELGTVVNGWIGGDPVAWRNIAERAVAYERRLPLSTERPTGVDISIWRALVERSRIEYAAQLKTAFDGLVPETFAAERRKAGLSVGPLSEPGPPLPDDWR